MRRLSLAATAIVFILVSLAGLNEASAQATGVQDFRLHQQYRHMRALGMGDAFIASADDYGTLFYNPAGLARLEKGTINLSLGAAGDTKIPGFYGEVKDASGTSNVADITNLLARNYGNFYSARLSLLQAVWARPRWGLAILPVDLSLDMSIRNLAAASLNIVAFQDTTIAYGRGWDVNWSKNARWSLGVTAKGIYRGYYNRALLASELAFNSNILNGADAKEGFTLDADIGMLWTPKVTDDSWLRFAKPSVGFVARNVADYGFITNAHLIDKNSGEPPRLGRRFDVGAKFDLPDWWIFKTRVAVDERDIGATNFTTTKGFHAGAEFLWKIRSWWQGGWRVGVNQGYFTAGFTGALGFLQLDLATWADELGTSDESKAVRMYGLKAQIDF